MPFNMDAGAYQSGNHYATKHDYKLYLVLRGFGLGNLRRRKRCRRRSRDSRTGRRSAWRDIRRRDAREGVA